jgi:hypothetical protein
MHYDTAEPLSDTYEEPNVSDAERHDDLAIRRPQVVVNTMLGLGFEVVSAAQYATDHRAGKAQHRCAGVILLVVDNGTYQIGVVVTKQRRKEGDHWVEKWELPKGGAKPQDKTPTDTARRELREETGAYTHDGYMEILEIPREVSVGLISGTQFFYGVTLRGTFNGRKSPTPTP